MTDGAGRLELSEIRLPDGMIGAVVAAERPAETGVVVLGGSSGRVDMGRARLLASLGTVAVALRWFGGEGQVPGICEVPLETFFAATDYLKKRGCRRIVFAGTSKGAEAGLLTAVHDPRIDGVIAFSPTSVVWGNIGPGTDGASWPERSSWSLRGTALPFVPTIPSWQATTRDGLASYRSLFEQCLILHADAIPAATIAVETTSADIVLVAGADDALWPSDSFAAAIVARRRAAGLPTTSVTSCDAGHRILLPGEKTPRSTQHAHGGSDAADARLGSLAWTQIRRILQVEPPEPEHA